jgi:hypothetical protein
VASESQEAVRLSESIASNARPPTALCLVLQEGLHPPGASVERLQVGRYACALAGASAGASHQRRIASVMVTPFSSSLSSSYRGNWCNSCVQQLVTNAPLPARDSTLSETSETRATANPAHNGVGFALGAGDCGGGGGGGGGTVMGWCTLVRLGLRGWEWRVGRKPRRYR